MISRGFLFTVAFCCVLTAGCGSRGDAELFSPEEVRQSTTETGRALPGYNPPMQYENGIGLRAAADGTTLLVSVDNRRDEPIIVGPDMFRLITPEGLYAFERGREDLSGFGVRTIEPEEHDVFVVRLPRGTPVVEYALVMNHPPTEMIQRVFIEEVATSNIEIELPPGREPER